MAQKLEGSNMLFLNANETVYIDGIEVNGTFGTNPSGGRYNGKINPIGKNIVVKDMVIVDGCEAYNIIECTGQTKYPTYNLVVDNVKCNDTALKHNIVNLYVPGENAVIEVSNGKYNLNVANSNVMRMANYGGAKNVKVLFKNIDWSYETAGGTEEDFKWGGILLYQPALSDPALKGDLSCLKTWTVIFDNCTYNGKKVTDINFGKNNQLLYGYNIGGDGEITDISSIVKVEIK